jgi:hypothetical protein
MKTWVKLYTEINRDPDIGSLTWAQRGIWTALLALAGEIDDRDTDELETGRLDTIDRVAWSIRCDLPELEDAVQEFERRGMVAKDPDGELFLVNYPKRQGRPPSAKPSAVAERVQRHRDKAKAECNEDVTRVQQGVTPSDTDPDPEKIQNRVEVSANAETQASQLTDGQRYFLTAFGAKRFRTMAQKAAILALERDFGTDTLQRGVDWAAKQGMNMGKAVISLETALPKWGKPKQADTIKVAGL